MWPSTEMSNMIMDRLKQKEFQYAYEHIAIKGGHAEVLDHFESVFKFLNENFSPN